MINEVQAQSVVQKMFSQGEVSSILSDGSILVRVGKSYTKVTPREVHNTLIQLKQPPREDLASVARELNAKEDGITQAKREAGVSERDLVASKYGIE